ncbi:MAG: hypothetical protein M5U29_03140 [Anaerolineae bacterium]|nr:hypothetical protein [Anaerolineae bacterium]
MRTTAHRQMLPLAQPIDRQSPAIMTASCIRRKARVMITPVAPLFPATTAPTIPSGLPSSRIVEK